MRTIADHLFDILENSVNAHASKIIVTISFFKHIFLCRIIDNGTVANLNNVTDPFVTSRKTRRVGLGLPLLKSTVEGTGGHLNLSRLERSSGTCLEFTVNMAHIDARPFGDISSVFIDALRSWPGIEFEIFINNAKKEKKILDTVELKTMLELDIIQDMEVLNYIGEQLKKALFKIGINQQFGVS
ncbi:MAG: hypothetical protein APR54_08525 [Candidatus Cloacimonas sp. SDB]|nr:MAG: hypothetical protein APR54_08525 [Candidatus Cloacimonas sp. SDB]